MELLVTALTKEILQLSWAWIGVGLTIEPTFEEISSFCNLWLYEQAFGQLLNLFILFMTSWCA